MIAKDHSLHNTSVAFYQYTLTVDSVEEMTRDSLTPPFVHVVSSIATNSHHDNYNNKATTFKYSLNLFMKEMKNSAFLMLPGMASVISIM